MHKLKRDLTAQNVYSKAKIFRHTTDPSLPKILHVLIFPCPIASYPFAWRRSRVLGRMCVINFTLFYVWKKPTKVDRLLWALDEVANIYKEQIDYLPKPTSTTRTKKKAQEPRPVNYFAINRTWSDPCFKGLNARRKLKANEGKKKFLVKHK